mmetsp:Transcript_21886/g.56824  ORF Transcript_21886/g.56824 Transcript_21886/m.56824 type:complete len:101 (+) Transcript_21886:432-734(+)
MRRKKYVFFELPSVFTSAQCLQELDILLKLVDAKDTPFVVLANKCDLDSSLPYNEFLNRFKLGNYINTTSDDQRKFNVFRTSFTEGTGVEEAFRWLNSVL